MKFLQWQEVENVQWQWDVQGVVEQLVEVDFEQVCGDYCRDWLGVVENGYVGVDQGGVEDEVECFEQVGEYQQQGDVGEYFEQYGVVQWLFVFGVVDWCWLCDQLCQVGVYQCQVEQWVGVWVDWFVGKWCLVMLVGDCQVDVGEQLEFGEQVLVQVGMGYGMIFVVWLGFGCVWVGLLDQVEVFGQLFVLLDLLFYVVVEFFVGYGEGEQFVLVVQFGEVFGGQQLVEGVFLLGVVFVVDFWFEVEFVNYWLDDVVVLFFGGGDVGYCCFWQVFFGEYCEQVYVVVEDVWYGVGNVGVVDLDVFVEQCGGDFVVVFQGYVVQVVWIDFGGFGDQCGLYLVLVVDGVVGVDYYFVWVGFECFYQVVEVFVG